MAASFLRLAELPAFPLDRLSRYEHLLWRQAHQLVFTLDSLRRRNRHPSRFNFLFSVRPGWEMISSFAECYAARSFQYTCSLKTNSLANSAARTLAQDFLNAWFMKEFFEIRDRFDQPFLQRRDWFPTKQFPRFRYVWLSLPRIILWQGSINNL